MSQPSQKVDGSTLPLAARREVPDWRKRRPGTVCFRPNRTASHESLTVAPNRRAPPRVTHASRAIHDVSQAMPCGTKLRLKGGMRMQGLLYIARGPSWSLGLRQRGHLMIGRWHVPSSKRDVPGERTNARE